MSKKPHHMHALTKASATHLHRQGHLSSAQHKKIVSAAEAGMSGAAGQPKAKPMGLSVPDMDEDGE